MYTFDENQNEITQIVFLLCTEHLEMNESNE